MVDKTLLLVLQEQEEEVQVDLEKLNLQPLHILQVLYVDTELQEIELQLQHKHIQ